MPQIHFMDRIENQNSGNTIVIQGPSS